MPIIRSAIKKMRKDKVRTLRNKKREDNIKLLLKKARLDRSKGNLSAVFSALDKAVKVNLIHKNKAARLKSRLSKGAPQVPSKPSIKKSTPKKSPAKKAKK